MLASLSVCLMNGLVLGIRLGQYLFSHTFLTLDPGIRYFTVLVSSAWGEILVGRKEGSDSDSNPGQLREGLNLCGTRSTR